MEPPNGCSMEDVRIQQLLQDAEDHLRQIEEKIAKLQSMRATLAELVEKCAGDHRPDCPIIEDLSPERLAK